MQIHSHIVNFGLTEVLGIQDPLIEKNDTRAHSNPGAVRVSSLLVRLGGVHLT
jgi:hypothetical protein